MKILVLNGPNLNMLGTGRHPLGGELTLAQLERQVAEYGLEQAEHSGQGNEPNGAQGGELELVFYQTNHEGQLIDMLQRAGQQYAGVIFNPAAYAGYSLALRCAVQTAEVPVAEVLLNELSGGKPPCSVIAEVCAAQFAGQGADPYCKALDYLLNSV